MTPPRAVLCGAMFLLVTTSTALEAAPRPSQVEPTRAEETSADDDAPQEEAQRPAAPEEDKDPNHLRDNDRPLTGQDLIEDDFPKSWPLFGSDYRLGFRGYLKLDYLQDFSGTGDRFQFVTGTIPVEGTPEAGVSGYMNMFVRESRFSFEVRKTTEGAPPQRRRFASRRRPSPRTMTS